MVFKIFSDGPPEGAGPGAMNDPHFLDALHGRAIQQSVHAAQGFLHSLSSKIDLWIEGSPSAGPLTTGPLGWAILLKSGILAAGTMGLLINSFGNGTWR